MLLLYCTSQEQEIDESSVLCCKRKQEHPTVLQNHMELGLIKPHARIDYLPAKARLLNSTCDQPSKTRMHKPNIHCTKEKPTKMATSNNEKTKILDDTLLITKEGTHHGKIS